MPYFYYHIVSSRADHAVLAIKSYRRNEMVMGVYYLLLFAEVQVPNSDGFVVRGWVKILSTWVQG